MRREKNHHEKGTQKGKLLGGGGREGAILTVCDGELS